MKRPMVCAIQVAFVLLSATNLRAQSTAASHFPMEGFVAAHDGVRLSYLDWGGTGPALVMLHGLGDNPHVFDDLAPAFTDRFHVIAYARRGSGNSDVKGPYDLVTLTADLLAVMDALGIDKADLAGYSAGGDEITQLAAQHPERVDRLIYLDAAYDWSDPAFKAAVQALPQSFFAMPASALSSLNAYREYQRTTFLSRVDDMRRIEANIRAKVVIQPDGSVGQRTSRETVDALYAALYANVPNFAQVRCPALAIYAEHLYDPYVSDPRQRAARATYERQYWEPFQQQAMAHVRRDMPQVRMAHATGSHGDFLLTDRQHVVELMRSFLATGDQER